MVVGTVVASNIEIKQVNSFFKKARPWSAFTYTTFVQTSPLPHKDTNGGQPRKSDSMQMTITKEMYNTTN